MNYLNKILRKIYTFFSAKSERSLLLKKNAIWGVLLNFISTGITLLLVPILLEYLNVTKYGIWLTIQSIFGWFVLMNFGIGNGLKNKLAECIAQNDFIKGQIYVSTAYVYLGVFALILTIIFTTASYFIDWGFFFNAPLEMSSEVNTVAFIVFSIFIISLFVNLIYDIFRADQRSAYFNLIQVFIKLISLILLVIVIKYSSNSLLLVGLILTVPMVIVPALSSFVFFKGKYQKLIPRLRFADRNYGKELLKIGLSFFILQVSVVLLYSSGNFIISHIFSPAQVTPYAITFKYFQVGAMAFTLLANPLWSAITQAYSLNDKKWIINIITKYVKVWIGFSILIVVMILVSPYIFNFWIGTKVIIPFTLSILMGTYVIQNAWLAIFTYFVNAIGKIRLQSMFAIIASIINVPLAILLGKHFNLGLQGIIISLIICLMPWTILMPMQYKKILNNKATGIWLK